METVLKYVRPRKGESASSSEQQHLVAYFSAWSTAGEAFITVSSSSEEMLEEGRAKLEKIISSKQAKLTRRKGSLNLSTFIFLWRTLSVEVQRLTETEKLYQVLLSIGPQLCIENAQKIIDFCDCCLERNYDVFIHYLKTHFGHFGGELQRWGIFLMTELSYLCRSSERRPISPLSSLSNLASAGCDFN